MTPTRERQDDSILDTGAPPWAERSILDSRPGLPLWGAILAAVLPTALGTVLDVVISSKPSYLLMACYFLGSVFAVGAVRRDSLFGPMVQAPLVVAIVMPVVLFLSGGSQSEDMTGKLLFVMQPLISSFPAMAGTTAVAVGLGLLRIFKLQRADEAEPDDPEKTAVKREAAERKEAAKREAAQRKETDRKAAADRRGSERGSSAEQGRKRPREGERSERARGRGDSGRPRPRDSRTGGESGQRRGESGRGSASGRSGQSGRGSVPPGRSGGGQRPAPGRSRPSDQSSGEQARRPRRPRRGDSFE